MAKKSSRSHSRKMKHTRKHKTHRRQTHRRRSLRNRRRNGGSEGAPVNYSLSGSWPSRMSLGQGADYFKYHEGQHGGGALSYGAFPAAVESTGLPADLRGPAHIGGIDKAIADVRGLCDPPNCPGSEQLKIGGARRNKNRRSLRNKSRRGGDRRNRRSMRNKSRRGGNRLSMRNRKNNAAVNAAVNAVTNAVVAENAAAVANVAAANANVAANVSVAAMNAPASGGRNRRSMRRARRNGGALGYAPFPSAGMLLSSQKAYAEAGLNPEWKTDVAFTDAKIRNTQ